MTEGKETGLVYTARLGNSNLQSLQKMGQPTYEGVGNLQNFDPNTPEGMMRFLSATGDTELYASELNGEVFELVHWLAEPAVFLNEATGETVTGVRITLWDADERRMTVTSWVVVRFMDALIKVKGPGPYKPAMGISIENVIRGDNKRSYKIQLVPLPDVRKERRAQK